MDLYDLGARSETVLTMSIKNSYALGIYPQTMHALMLPDTDLVRAYLVSPLRKSSKSI